MTLGAHPPCARFWVVHSKGPSAVPEISATLLASFRWEDSERTVEVASKGCEPADLIPDAREEPQRPLDVDIALRVAYHEYLASLGLLGELEDVVSDILGGRLGVFERAGRGVEPGDVVSRPSGQLCVYRRCMSETYPLFGRMLRYGPGPQVSEP